MSTRGVVYVHSTPAAVRPHVEWAIARVLETPVRLHWTPQPVDPGAHRAECDWSGRPGTGAQLAHALRQWSMLRFEVSEEPSPGCDGERFMHVPNRGLFHAPAGAAGDVQLGEHQLREIMRSARGPEALAHALERALGAAWDHELEPYRYAGDGAPVTLLTQVG
ncbi:hypothetical protein GCM10010124_21470 [Pilimelia terevasa]|uniref:DUF3145 domain-containing protein n=1 Tax=Pilimelia terevasa TaxID=53372 RepID=A0A8J3FHF8_9ACTN|nr:DUF3145 domain-containing protein [Pilimelia terevasa]GGK28518.1 hypothetical protein GCM10010124_21470 [Pilimelia terevasa]